MLKIKTIEGEVYLQLSPIVVEVLLAIRVVQMEDQEEAVRLELEELLGALQAG